MHKHWQITVITEVSNSTKRHADNSGNHVDLWPVELCHNTRDLMAQFCLKFLFITQHEVPFISTSEATKRSSGRTENGKMSRTVESRVGESTPFHTCISGQSRQREGRELFRYCYFYFIVMNHGRRCFGPNHTSLMQIKRNSVTALLSACYWSNLFSVNL